MSDSQMSGNSAGAGPRIDRNSVDVADWRDLNHANWEARVPVHLGPNGYDIAAFADDPDLVSDVVAFDRPRLGDISGKRVVHLQCHIGTDTLSLARLGAKVSGLDFSGSALEAARDLVARAGVDIDFVEADAYDAVEAFGAGSFDVVYTGIGAICWLADIDRWARVVADLLVDGGELIIRDAHPMLGALDDEVVEGQLVVNYPYFADAGVVWVDETSYAGDGEVASPICVDFNHSLSNIFNALWAAGMEITHFDEHDSAPWAAFPKLMEAVDGGEYRLKDRPDRVAMTFTIKARKVNDTSQA